MSFSIVVYEGGSVMSQARSLWRLELARTKWSGGFINWYHPMRIRHLTTGRYLGVNENNELVLVMSTLSVIKSCHNEMFKINSYQEMRRQQHKRHFACVKRKMIKKLFLKIKI